MSRMSATIIYALTILTVIVNGAPNRRSKRSIPSWHLPCGEVIENEIPNSENIEDEIRASLQSIKLQHQLTMNDYLNRDYEFLYESVRIGVHEHQYIPNWVPGKKDVNMVKNLAHTDNRTIANHLPKFHTDLQKFAVALEELVADESNIRIQEALRATQNYLTMLLCEIESNIAVLPSLRIPSRVQRSIMSNNERQPVDITRRLVRDWGIILKYKDYLHAWRHVFDY